MRTSWLALLLCFGACESADPLTKARPALPPDGAGRASRTRAGSPEANFAAESISPGPASQGLVGDYFMRNDKVRVVVQAPGRAIGPCPYGGNVIDMDFVDTPAGDQLGEVSPLLQLGRTLNALDATIVRDGSEGGPAVLRFTGRDAWDDFIDIRGIGSFAAAIDASDLPDAPSLGWQIEVTYILSPGATSLRTIYTFYNPTQHDRQTTWGTLSDTGAKIEIFHEATRATARHLACRGRRRHRDPDHHLRGAAGRRARLWHLADLLRADGARRASLPVAGVNVEVYQLSPRSSDAFGDAGKSLTEMPAGGTTRRASLDPHRP